VGRSNDRMMRMQELGNLSGLKGLSSWTLLRTSGRMLNAGRFQDETRFECNYG
jgi:hypothetical protein